MRVEITEGHTFINHIKKDEYINCNTLQMQTTDAETLEDVIEAFRLYLFGCGFSEEGIGKYFDN